MAMPNLPEEIILDILLRLPITSLGLPKHGLKHVKPRLKHICQRQRDRGWMSSSKTDVYSSITLCLCHTFWW
ncbi:hypothetical protein CsSME_00033383 [Camellia sinensis var. sinensis]